MALNRLLPALAAVVMPALLLPWVELVSVDQPAKVQPGARFTASVDAVVYEQWPSPPPLDDGTSPIPADGYVWLRLGVLVPEGWIVEPVVCQVSGGEKISLQPASLDETARYKLLRAPPPSYSWQAFGPVRVEVGEGAAVKFSAEIITGERSGIYQVGYMTWPGPQGPSVTGQEEQTQPGEGTIADAPSSYLETRIAVGEVGPAPKVVAFDPPHAAADVPVDVNVRVAFDRDMDVQSLRGGGVLLYEGAIWFANGQPSGRNDRVRDPGSTSLPIPPMPYLVPALVFYNAETRTAVIEPREPLRAGTSYTVLVTREARSAEGVPLEVPVASDFLTAPGPSVPLFVDVPLDHIFREAIETLARAGVIEGYPDDTFRPYAPLTRAQLATMLVRLLGVHTPELDAPTTYTDIEAVPNETADFVGEATKAGIVEGFPDGTFRPNETVTRIQLVRMVVRASENWLSPPPPGFDAGFVDVLPLDLSFVNWAFFNDLVEGKSPGRFDPWSNATRGHASRVLFGVWLTMPYPEPLEKD